RYMFFLGYILSEAFINLTGAKDTPRLFAQLSAAFGEGHGMVKLPPGTAAPNADDVPADLQDRTAELKRAYGDSAKKYVTGFATLFGKIKQFAEVNEVGANELKPGFTAWQQTFCQRLAWFPANLFLGPLSENRLDDPRYT